MDNQNIENKNFELQKLQIILQLYQNAKQQNVIAADRVINEANKTEAGLRNIQFTLATFLFTFTTPIFTKNVFNSNDIRILILLAWIFLLMSILAGFLHMSKVINFFLKQAELHTKKI